jgi:hypothetical protein
MEFDDIVVRKDIDRALPFFSDQCEIEILGITLNDKAGERKWLE